MGTPAANPSPKPWFSNWMQFRELKGIMVGDLLRRYSETVTPTKRGAGSEQYRIRTLLTHSLAQIALNKLSSAAIARYRDDRLKLVQSGTVRRELAIVQHCFEVVKKEWGLPIATNPVQQIAIPEAQKPRERRLEDGESNILASAALASAWYLHPLITLAIETGMRRGELLSIRWKDVDMTAPTIRILKTKNGHPRTIPLTPKAVEILSTLERRDERVFPVTPNAVRLAWGRLRKRAGLEDLRLHDLRHEAVSRFFEYGLTVPEVALISGHRDPRMLSRYTHLRPEKVAEKLAKATLG
ncbi:tyrosine-type recombinase/integrase [Microvirga ossetica]|nr:site-specific integrase [Microvirga ossetica]